MFELPMQSIKNVTVYSAFAEFAMKRGRDLGHCDAARHHDTRLPCQAANRFPAGFVQVKLCD